VIEKIVEFRQKTLAGICCPPVAWGREAAQKPAPSSDENIEG